MLPNFNTPWWDGYWNGIGTAWLAWLFNYYFIQPVRKAWKKTAKEMKKIRMNDES